MSTKVSLSQISTTGASSQQVLTYNSSTSTWVASAAPNVGASLQVSDFTGTNQSLSANGYQKLPGGLIIQWGSSVGTYATNTSITFPVSFLTNCKVSVALQMPGNSTKAFGWINNLTNNGFAWYWDRTGGYDSSGTLSWFAIGY